MSPPRTYPNLPRIGWRWIVKDYSQQVSNVAHPRSFRPTLTPGLPRRISREFLVSDEITTAQLNFRNGLCICAKGSGQISWEVADRRWAEITRRQEHRRGRSAPLATPGTSLPRL